MEVGNEYYDVREKENGFLLDFENWDSMCLLCGLHSGKSKECRCYIQIMGFQPRQGGTSPSLEIFNEGIQLMKSKLHLLFQA